MTAAKHLIFKIVDKSAWAKAEAGGQFLGSPVDLTDGYMHFSAPSQLAETARRHFAGKKNLVLVAIGAESLGDNLKWEPSRGGDLFPHLYGPLSIEHVVWVKELLCDENGKHIFP